MKAKPLATRGDGDPGRMEWGSVEQVECFHPRERKRQVGRVGVGNNYVCAIIWSRRAVRLFRQAEQIRVVGTVVPAANIDDFSSAFRSSDTVVFNPIS